jgi:predicted acyl esterase
MSFSQIIKEKLIDNGSSGPYKSIAVTEKSLPDFVVYRPKDIKKAVKSEGKLPVIVWANGGCMNSSIHHEKLLSEVASHGYIIVAIGELQMTVEERINKHTPDDELLKALDWISKQAITKGSNYYQNVDLGKIAAGGQSCGGAQVFRVANDNRIKTYMIFNAGMGNMTMAGASTNSLKNLRGKIIYIIGGESDVAYQNAIIDNDKINNAPVVFANHITAGHGGTFANEYGGSFGQMAIDWLDWQFKGKDNSAIFLKNDLSKYPGWSMKAKNFQLDPSVQKRISKPGTYEGYSEVLYDDEFSISSQYVEMRDGVKLAIDIYRPKDSITGKVVESPLPVVWMHTPYNRRYNNTKDKLTVDCYAGSASQLVKYGYVVATVDFRGLYASFGHNEGYNRGEWISAARTDAYDITEWLAKQPWSNGKIGMWGCSATGGSQMQAVTEASPHLKAIFPMSFEFDVYDFRMTGGISGVRGADRPRKPGDPLPHESRDVLAAPVDNDKDSILLKQAKKDHIGTIEDGGSMPYRDSYSEILTDEASKQWWIKSSPSSYLHKINASGVAMYMAVNWDEGNTKPGPFFAFNNFTIPRKLIVGPGYHCDWFTSMKLTGFDIVIEELRFFDYWLKGIDNGIMDEAPVYYYTYNAPKGKEWSSSKSWPLQEEKRVKYYLGEGGTIDTKKPETKDSKSKTKVNFDLRSEIKDGLLIYETAPLSEDVCMTGHPELNLWVSSTTSDGDFIAVIKDVASDGTVTSYNVTGQIRGSMRKVADPPYNYLGLPWRSYMGADVVLLNPGVPTEIAFQILPISMIFKAGHKIRLEISFATRGTTKIDPAPEVTIYHDTLHPSC